MRQHNLRVTGSLTVNGENVISASELAELSSSINSKIEGLNPSQIGTGSYTASISPEGTFSVNTNTTITGSLSVTSLSGSGINYLAYSGGVVTAISGTAAIKYNEEFTAELGQTTFTPAIGYITNLIDVFYNGTKLSAETDYTASNGSTIILTQGADKAGDIIELAIYNPVSGVSNNTLRQQTTFTAAVSQTTFLVNYTPGLIDVYFNGSHLANEEYTANNGTSIILSEAATGGEIVDVFVYSYQVGAFSGIGGQGQAGQFAYFSSQNGISGSDVIAISGSDVIVGGNIIPLQSGSSDLGSLENPFRHIYVGTGSIYLVDNSGQVTNTISAQTIVTTDTLASGTIDLTDSLPSGTVSGSSQVVGILSSLNTATASFTPRITNLESKSASVDISITNINSFTASNSNESLNLKTGSYATTGSNTFFGTQTYSGSVYIANDLIVQGSSSIQYISASSVSIGTNIVQLNTANPSVRFAGLTIIDSGSVGGSGSFLYDSVQDEFIFVHRGNGTNITSSHFVLGPETYDSLGNETYLTSNIIPKGTGKEHLVDSCIFDNGVTTCIKNNLVGTGTISGTNIYASTVSCSPVGCFTTLCTEYLYPYNISMGNTFIRANGNKLGIGTGNPLGVLSITGGQNSLSSLATYSSIEPLGIFNMFYINSGTYPFYLDIAAIGDTLLTNGGSNIRFLTHCGTANATPVERMRIDNCGRVGIGTTTAIGRLTISQDTDCLNSGLSINSTSNYVPKSAIHINSFGTGTGAGITFENKSINTAWMGHRGGSSTNLHFEQENGDFVFAAGTYAQIVDHTTPTLMTIKKNGNVSIGTQTPNEKLDVNGAIQVRGESLGYGTTQCVGMLDWYAGNTRFLAFGGNGSTYGGFNWYASRQNNSGGRSVMNILPTGQVTKPFQPYAAVGITGSYSTTGQIIVWNQVHTNNGNHYNSSTGLFTVPVAGHYLVSIMVMTDGVDQTLDINLRINGTGTNALVPYQSINGGVYNQVSGMTILALAANDTIGFALNSGSVYGSSGGRHSSVTFALLG